MRKSNFTGLYEISIYRYEYRGFQTPCREISRSAPNNSAHITLFLRRHGYRALNHLIIVLPWKEAMLWRNAARATSRHFARLILTLARYMPQHYLIGFDTRRKAAWSLHGVEVKIISSFRQRVFILCISKHNHRRNIPKCYARHLYHYWLTQDEKMIFTLFRFSFRW